MSLSKVLSFHVIAIIVSYMAVVLPAQGEVNKPQPADTKAAIVNGAPIYRVEFDAEVLKVQNALLEYGRPLTSNQVASVGKEVLERMVRREIIYQESRKAGIKTDEDAVNKDINALRQQFPTEAEYRNELIRKNISEEMLRTRLEKNRSIQQYVDRIAEKITVEDSDMVTYYQSHLNLFRLPLQARVSHILIQTDPKWEEPRKQEARRKAEQIIKDLQKGKDFAAIAREQSDGPTRTNGGDLGYIRPGQMEKQFESAVFALQPEETTSIIETNYGLHILKLMDKKPETVLAYENVKDKIRQFLREEKAKKEADLQAKTLREKAAVEIFLSEDKI